MLFQLPSVFSIYSTDLGYSVQTTPQDDGNFKSSMVKFVEDEIALNHESNFKDTTKETKYEAKKTTIGEYWSTTMALFWKNVTRLRRNIP